MQREWIVRHRFSVMFVIFLICIYGYSIGRVYGFIFFPDEFGYWAYAAKAAGYDWSETVSLGSYYSYGYSLILFPIFKLCKDSVAAYRIAVSLNFILLGIVYFMLLWLAKKICGVKKRNELFAAIAVFYPSWLFFVQTTMVETLLMTMFVVISVLFYDFLKRNKLSTLILLVIVLVYIHFLHMRAIGVTIAGMMTLLLFFLLQNGKAKQFLLAVGISATVLGGGFAIKEVLQNALYTSAGAELIKINDYAGQFEKIFYLFTKEGAQDFLFGLAGKILYLGLASFGTVYWGLVCAVKQLLVLWRQIRRGEKRDLKRLFFLFVILSAFAEILINAIFNIRPIRVDSVTYGRYHEFILPVLMLLGLYEMARTKKMLLGSLVIVLVQLPMVEMVLSLVEKYKLTNFHGYIMVGMSCLYEPKIFEPKRFYLGTYLIGSIVSLLVAGVTVLAKEKKREILLVLVITLELVLAIKASSLYIEESAFGAYRDTTIVHRIEQLQQENPDRRIVYIREDDSPFVSIIQFMMRDSKLEMVEKREQIEEYTEQEMDADDIIMLKFDSSYTDEVSEKYKKQMLNGHFVICYNP